MLTSEELLKLNDELEANDTGITIFYIPKVLDSIKGGIEFGDITNIQELIDRYAEEGDILVDFHHPYITIEPLSYEPLSTLNGIHIIIDSDEGPDSYDGNIELAFTEEKRWLYNRLANWKPINNDNDVIEKVLKIIDYVLEDKDYLIQTDNRSR